MNWNILSLISMGAFSAVQADLENRFQTYDNIFWLDWQPWSHCSRSCAGGVQQRVRTCMLSAGHLGCRKVGTKVCNTFPCKQQRRGSTIGPWEQWSSCTVSCGGGFQERTRHCDIRICGQKQFGYCNNQVCEQDAFRTTTQSPASNWGVWSKCSQTCGKGVERRTRTCERIRVCRGRSTQERYCSVRKCPPEWSNWGGWSTCSATCDEGLEKRMRKCQGGQGCEGDSKQNRKCSFVRCAPETESKEWGAWSECSISCGVGNRVRSCGNPSGKCEGFPFARETKEKWTEWGSWTYFGKYGRISWAERRRTCDGGTGGGGNCPGRAREFKKCERACPDARCPLIRTPSRGWIENAKKVYVTGDTINIKCNIGFFPEDGSEKLTCLNTGRWSAEPAKCAGRWKEWSSWSECSASCGGGKAQRRRECSATLRFFCTGSPTETSKCNEKRCPLPACGKAGNIGNIFNQELSAARVIAGTDAAEGAWPWQAMIFSNSNYNVKNSFRIIRGGGSVLNAKWILTAAHVFEKIDLSFRTKNWTEAVLLVLGITTYPGDGDLPGDAHVFEPELVIIHPSYDRTLRFLDYDVAMVKVGRNLRAMGGKLRPQKLNGIIPFSMKIRPVCLPCISDLKTGESATGELIQKFDGNTCRVNESFTMKKTNETVYAVVTGHGTIEKSDLYGRKIPDVLQQGLLRLADNGTCYEAVGKIKAKLKGAIFTHRMICTLSGKKHIQADACRGDSGGPLVRRITNPDGSTRWVQIGIVSWGLGCANTDSAGLELPGFFTKLTQIMSFIVQSVRDNAP